MQIAQWGNNQPPMQPGLFQMQPNNNFNNDAKMGNNGMYGGSVAYDPLNPNAAGFNQGYTNNF